MVKLNKKIILGSLALFFCLFLTPALAVNHPPTVGNITSSAGVIPSEQPITFTATYFDPDGVEDISEAHLYIAALPQKKEDGYTRVFCGYYSLKEDKLYLYEPREDGKLLDRKGGFNPGSANIIENDFIILDCRQTKTRDSGDKLKILWRLTFKSTCPSGNYDFYLAVKDNAGSYVPWQLKGRWGIPEPPEPTGPEGKQISSADNQAKITIPEGALDSPKIITISNLNKDSFQRLAPENKPVLSVVECKPDGTAFKKPVTITSILSQAQIPGTPVEIGLYKNDRIELTGQKSSISADGYTVSFQVEHFSTYALIRTPGSSPIGANTLIPMPDLLTGAFTHSIPITVPPGRKGIQPNLALQYRTANPNSWVGMGWSLCPGYITRDTRQGPANFTDEDTFVYRSQSSSIQLVKLTDNLYQAKIESTFTQFYKEGDTWRTIEKDGTIMGFGETPESKEEGSGGTFAWYITKVKDTSRNYIRFNYSKDGTKNYLSSIEYTGNEKTGLQPKHRVVFITEKRPDLISSFISGNEIVTGRRLKYIEARIDDKNETNKLVWRYVFDYKPSPDTSRSLLDKVTQYGNDGKSFPVISMEYQKAKD